MKQSDFFAIGAIATVGTLAAFFGVGAFLGDPDELVEQVPTIGTVTSDLTDPDPELFNRNAINPTVEVYVGDCEDYDKNGIIDLKELVLCEVYDPSVLIGTEFEKDYYDIIKEQNEDEDVTKPDEDEDRREDDDDEDE